MIENLRYYIFDPTGNITALVESEVAIADQPAVASCIMEQHPDVEQVGFVTYADDAAAAGVPGVDSRIDEIAPPNMPPE